MGVLEWILVWLGVSFVACLVMGYVMGSDDYNGDYK